MRGRTTVRFTGVSRSRVTTWTLAVDGSPAVRRPQTYPRGITVDTRHLTDGWHALRAEARDFPGNTGVLDWSIRVDNTPPSLILRRIVVGRVGGPVRGRATRPRPVRLLVAASDPGATGLLGATVTVTTARGGARVSRSRALAGLRPGPAGRSRPVVSGAAGTASASICATAPATRRPFSAALW